MNVVEQAENLAEVHVARMQTHAAVWCAVFDNAKHLGPIERGCLAETVAQYAADAMRDATLIVQAKGGDK